MRCLIDIINRFSPLVSFDIYDVREMNYRNQSIRYLYFDGGPGDPLVGDGSWDTKYYELIDALTKWNLENPVKSMCCLFVIPFRWLANILVWQKSRKGTILPSA
jgi:hypothetical protein